MTRRSLLVVVGLSVSSAIAGRAEGDIIMSPAGLNATLKKMGQLKQQMDAGTKAQRDEAPPQRVVVADRVREGAFGRWDARIGKRPEWATTLGGAFDPLPICPPGMTRLGS